MVSEVKINFTESYNKKMDPDTWDNIVSGVVKDSLLQIEATLKRTKFQNPTGRLNRGHHAVINMFEGKVENRVQYWHYVNFGTKPHIITPRRGKALHWVSGGQHHYARQVQHPGIKPRHFVEAAVTQFYHKDMDRIIRNNIRRAGVT